MTINPEITQAIKESVREAGQPDLVGKKLIAWLEAISNSELSADAKSYHLDVVYQAISIGKLDNNYDN